MEVVNQSSNYFIILKFPFMVLHQKHRLRTFKLLCVTLSVIYRVELYRFIIFNILNFEEIEQATEHEKRSR